MKELSTVALLALATIFSIVHVASQETPELTIAEPVIFLTETETKQIELGDVITCATTVDVNNTDSSNMRVYVQSTSPTSPCGKCFPVWPTGTGDYQLMLTPSLGTLEGTPGSSYTISVVCTDDDEDVTQTIRVVLDDNSAPTFDIPNNAYNEEALRLTENTRAWDTVFTVHAEDVEGDAVFYSLEADPHSDFFEIGYNGEIYATQDMRLICDTDAISLEVETKDVHNDVEDTVEINLELRNRNIQPVIDVSMTEVLIDEDVAIGTTVVGSLNLDDDTLYDTARYKMRADPVRGLEYYALEENGGDMRIVTISELDYEYEYLRDVTLYVDVTDGFCDAETYVVTVKIQDVNELPIINPDSIKRSVYEGFISLDPGWVIEDPDEDDEDITWAFISGTDLYIDQDSGVIYSDEELDIDSNRKSKTNTYRVRVLDHKREIDVANIVIKFKDQNDNPPIFTSDLYKVSANNCTGIGSLVGTVDSDDQDSDFEENDNPVYSGTGSLIAVLSTGEVRLKAKCVPGQVETIQANVEDQGTYPGPLSGVPATVQFTCNVCPDPDPVTTAAPTEEEDVDNGNDADGLGLNLTWAVLAGLLALLLLALLAYVIWRFCVPACKRRWLHHEELGKDKAKEPKADERKEKDPTSVVVMPIPPTLPPEKKGALYDFWKENYWERDQRSGANAHVQPYSEAKDKEVGEEERKVTEREEEERREKRRKEEEEHQEKLEKYREEIRAIRRNRGSGKSKSKCPCCVIL